MQIRIGFDIASECEAATPLVPTAAGRRASPVSRIGRILMVRGRDAADVPMMTSFGNSKIADFKVWADAVNEGNAVRLQAPALPSFNSASAVDAVNVL